MKTLTFNDGTTVHGYGIEEGNNLYVYIHGKTLEETSSILNNPNMTCRMVSSFPTGEVEHVGFIVAKNITEEDELFISATMSKERNEEETDNDDG